MLFCNVFDGAQPKPMPAAGLCGAEKAVLFRRTFTLVGVFHLKHHHAAAGVAFQ